MKRAGPPVLALLILLVIWEGGLILGLFNRALFPAPSQIFTTMWELRADFGRAFFETASTTLIAYLLAALLGFALAFGFSLQPLLRRAILPFAIFFQTVPIIAIAPLLVIYFGYGPGTVVASALLVAIFPVLANTLIGLQSISVGDLELFRIYGATPAQFLFRLRLPRAYVSIYSGLKISAGLAVIGSVAGEFVAGGGLGALIDAARTQQRIDIVFAALILLSALGLTLIGLLQLGHRQLNRWRPYGLTLNDGANE